MGMFTNIQKDTATSVYDNLKKYLVEKNGYKHILMINSFSKLYNQTFQCDDKYTTQINEIINSMQVDGYEIIDIKFMALPNQGLTKQMEGFNTLIIYK